MSGGSAAQTAWELLFQYSPILLTNSGADNGIAPAALGGVLPIIAITEAVNFPLGLMSGLNVSLDNMFATYQVLRGTSLLEYEVARFPFANSTVAANATIKQPTSVSMLMICPAKNSLGWFAKLAITEALTYVLNRHQLEGGTFTIATPSQIFTNCVFRGMRDSSAGSTNQLQNSWQLDFEKPLLTVSDADRVFGSLAQLFESGGKALLPGYSGIGAPISTAVSVAAPGAIPAAVPSIGANTVAGSNPLVMSGGGFFPS